jgi:hypothetical protein
MDDELSEWPPRRVGLLSVRLAQGCASSATAFNPLNGRAIPEETRGQRGSGWGHSSRQVVRPNREPHFMLA